MDWGSFGAGLGGVGAGLAGMFGGGGGNNPYKGAGKFYNKIPGAVSPYYNPWIQAGQGALGNLQGQYGELMNDPNGFIGKLGAGYQQSPGFKWQLNQGMNAANNAAAAGGMAGSPQHQQQASEMAEGLANQDYYNYLNKVLGAYGTGLQGEQGIAGMGYGAGDQMARIMADMYSQQAQLKFAGNAAQNQNQGSQWGDIFGGLGSMLGGYFGGPPGAMAGNSLGSWAGSAAAGS
jgi:hypothetical protein